MYRNKVIDIFKRFCSVDLKTREKIKGLEPARADIIIGGTAILLKILEMLDIESFIVSENDILDGIVYSLLPDATLIFFNKNYTGARLQL